MLSRLGDDTGRKKSGNVEKQFVVFNVGQEEFGVDIKQTREIIGTTDLTFIPNAPDFVNGVINLRGEIVPVVDLYKRLSLAKNSVDNEDNKIIIVELEGKLIGMKVNNVKEIIRMDIDNIGDPPAITQGINRKYVGGVGKLEDRLLILLNLNKILSKEEIEKINEMELQENE